MDDAFYFGQGRLVSYNRFSDDNGDGTNVNVKKNGAKAAKAALYKMLSPLLSSISNFQMYNKSILRYKANDVTELL
jgi:hypothetical protein